MAWYNPKDIASSAYDVYRKYTPGGKIGGEAYDELMGKNPSRLDQAQAFAPIDPNGALAAQAGAAGDFAGIGEAGYADRAAQMQGVIGDLERIRSGQESLSALQLKDALAQNRAQQASIAAGAAPANAAMAARGAARSMAMLGNAAANQQALAGIQERQAAAQSLGDILGGMRGQDLQAALGGRQTAIGGLGDLERARTERFNAAMGQETQGEKSLGIVSGLGQMMAAGSDRRMKTDIAPGGGQTFLAALSDRESKMAIEPGGGRQFLNQYATEAGAPGTALSDIAHTAPAVWGGTMRPEAARGMTDIAMGAGGGGRFQPMFAGGGGAAGGSFADAVRGVAAGTGGGGGGFMAGVADAMGGRAGGPSPVVRNPFAGGVGGGGGGGGASLSRASGDRAPSGGSSVPRDYARTLPAGYSAQGRQLLDGLRDTTYRYRNPSAPGAAPGRQVGIMAQDLERSPLGARAVFPGPNGQRMVDTTRLAHGLAAGAANLNDRLTALEERRLRGG